MILTGSKETKENHHDLPFPTSMSMCSSSSNGSSSPPSSPHSLVAMLSAAASSAASPKITSKLGAEFRGSGNSMKHQQINTCKEPSGSGTPPAMYNSRIAGSRGTCGLLAARANSVTSRRRPHAWPLMMLPGKRQRVGERLRVK